MFLLGALGFGLLLGAVNATAIAYGKVVPFVATLAMLAIARGLALQMSDKKPISLLDADGVRWFGTGKILGQPVSILFFLAITVIGWLLLNRTRYGRHVVSVGGNREAARIAGVPVRRTIFSVYCLSGLLAGFAAGAAVRPPRQRLAGVGRACSSSTRSAPPSSAAPASPAAGRPIVGTFMGVIVFGIIFNLLTQLDLATEWQQIVKGGIILVAALIQRPERI